MKTPRYKFDEKWMESIRLMPYISVEYTERMIRDYIEGKRTEEYVNHEFCETYFECAWVLIKAQIDARKERNERARLKRVARREARLAEAARKKAIEDKRIARQEAARKAEADAAAPGNTDGLQSGLSDGNRDGGSCPVKENETESPSVGQACGCAGGGIGMREAYAFGQRQTGTSCGFVDSFLDGPCAQ